MHQGESKRIVLVRCKGGSEDWFTGMNRTDRVLAYAKSEGQLMKFKITFSRFIIGRCLLRKSGVEALHEKFFF